MCFVTGDDHISLVVVTNLHLLGVSDKQPFCYVFNSSDDRHNERRVLETITSYLQFANGERRAGNTSKAIKLNRVEKIKNLQLRDSGLTLPKQPNSAHCGLYALQFAEEIYISLSKNDVIRRDAKYEVVTSDFCNDKLAFAHEAVLVCFCLLYLNSKKYLYLLSQDKRTKMKLYTEELKIKSTEHL
jgi:hypothetical protein